MVRKEGNVMNAYDVSVDPGTNATGVCPWINGKLVSSKLVTLRPPKAMTDNDEKIAWMVDNFRHFLRGITALGQHKIGRVAIENFETFHTRDQRTGAAAAKEAMMKCSTMRGALFAVALEFTGDVKSYSKHQTSKLETGYLARSRGVTGSKDALDAFQIGVCAGFDRIK
jgi:hypothetical protein